jgi:SAM-dependent methyltransferase
MRAYSEYNSTFADFYDYIAVYVNRADVPFYVEEARAAAMAAPAGATPVLELGCGSGRVLIPIAAAGVSIMGLDLSEAMLEKCRARLAAQPADVRERVRLVQGTMADFQLREKFQLITTPFRSFQHLITVEQQLACLRCVREHLAPGGRLILDMFHTHPAGMHDPAWQEEKEDCPLTKLPDGRSFRRTARITKFRRAEQCNDVEFNFYITAANGRTERFSQQFPIRYFFRFEVEHLLARAGFRVTAVYGNFDCSPFSNDSPDMITVAELG